MRHANSSGFTLLEMLVALVVLSLGVLSLLNLTGESTRTAVLLEDRSLAAVVAENHAVALLSSMHAPVIGKTDGEDELAERRWRWTETVAVSPDPAILRIDIAVSTDRDPQVVGAVTVFRRR